MEIRLNDSNWLEGGYISATGRKQLLLTLRNELPLHPKAAIHQT
jgi:hypothetical protein